MISPNSTIATTNRTRLVYSIGWDELRGAVEEYERDSRELPLIINDGVAGTYAVGNAATHHAPRVVETGRVAHAV